MKSKQTEVPLFYYIIHSNVRNMKEQQQTEIDKNLKQLDVTIMITFCTNQAH